MKILETSSSSSSIFHYKFQIDQPNGFFDSDSGLDIVHTHKNCLNWFSLQTLGNQLEYSSEY